MCAGFYWRKLFAGFVLSVVGYGLWSYSDKLINSLNNTSYETLAFCFWVMGFIMMGLGVVAIASVVGHAVTQWIKYGNLSE